LQKLGAEKKDAGVGGKGNLCPPDINGKVLIKISMNDLFFPKRLIQLEIRKGGIGSLLNPLSQVRG
jgi:hypothetical protein